MIEGDLDKDKTEMVKTEAKVRNADDLIAIVDPLAETDPSVETGLLAEKDKVSEEDFEEEVTVDMVGTITEASEVEAEAEEDSEADSVEEVEETTNHEIRIIKARIKVMTDGTTNALFATLQGTMKMSATRKIEHNNTCRDRQARKHSSNNKTHIVVHPRMFEMRIMAIVYMIPKPVKYWHWPVV